MKSRLLLLIALLTGVCPPPLPALDRVTTRSQSGQFIVSGLPVGRPLFQAPAHGATPSAVSYLRLDPTLIAVSCERIKQALLEELAQRDPWRGAVHISVRPVRAAGEEVTITSVRHLDGWSYRIELPELLDRERFVRSVVQVLLLDLANPAARAPQVELPPWLAGGMAAHLQAATLATLAVEPETSVARKESHADPLRAARAALRDRAPLTLNELNLPSDEQWAGRDAALYQHCAHLFVAQLLQLRRGPECLRAMLARLAEHLNWQTAFLEAFHPHFLRLIDADKWWSLRVIHLAGRDRISAWPHDTTWSQLEDILATPLEVRLDPKALPLTTQVKLQTLLAEWEFSRQLPVARTKINHLHALSLRAAPGLAGLVKDYQATLEGYLQKRDKLGAALGTRQPAEAALKSLVRETTRRLDALDARRETLRQTPDETAAVN